MLTHFKVMSGVHYWLEVTEVTCTVCPLWDRVGSLSPMTSFQVTAETSREECSGIFLVRTD